MSYDIICADTTSILQDHQDTITVWRNAGTLYDAAGIGVENWTRIGTFLGDWQPVSGITMLNEAGLFIKTEAIIIGPCDANIEVNDKVYRSNGAFLYVVYIWEFEDHKTIHLRKAEGSN